MADLGGAVVGAVVDKLLDQVVDALKHLKNAPKNIRRLRQLVERSLARVKELCSRIQDEKHPSYIWLTELHKQLKKSLHLVNAFRRLIEIKIFVKRYVKRYRISKESVEVYDSIYALLVEANIHLGDIRPKTTLGQRVKSLRKHVPKPRPKPDKPDPRNQHKQPQPGEKARPEPRKIRPEPQRPGKTKAPELPGKPKPAEQNAPRRHQGPNHDRHVRPEGVQRR